MVRFERSFEKVRWNRHSLYYFRFAYMRSGCYINRYEETCLQLYTQTGRYQILSCGQFVAKYQISRSHLVKISKALPKKPRLIIMWASRGTY